MSTFPPLIWVDLEMTGLNPEHDRILEIAVIVTDSALNTIVEGPVFAIHQPESLLASMDEWNTTHHTASGLIQRVRESAVTEQAAEEAMLHLLRAHAPQAKSPLCGNSVWQDRRFLARYMP